MLLAILEFLQTYLIPALLPKLMSWVNILLGAIVPGLALELHA